MTYCAYEQQEFAESEFETDQNGVVWHKTRSPRHTTLGEVEGGEIPGLEEIPPDDSG